MEKKNFFEAVSENIGDANLFSILLTTPTLNIYLEKIIKSTSVYHK